LVTKILPVNRQRTEGIRKRRLQKRWTDDVEENLKIIRIRNWHIVARPEGMEKSIGSHSPQEAGGLEEEETEEEEEEEEETKEKRRGGE
jgi:hypothetical protein